MKDDVALITGASQGIGRAIAEALAAQGTAVGLIGRKVDPLEEIAARCRQLGAKVCVAAGDVSDERSIASTIKKVQDELGDIGILVNNAGVSQPEDLLLEGISPQEWNSNIDINLKGTYLTCHYLLKGMKERGRGTIINIGSTAAHNAGAGNTAYAASKFAVRALTEGLAKECQGTGVKVFLISPGPVDTTIWDKKKKPPGPELRAKMLHPEDIAEIALWLISRPDHVRIDEIIVVPRGW